MSDALQIFAEEGCPWSDRTQVAAATGRSQGSGNQQRLLALAAALCAWSVVALVGGLAWLAIG